MIHENIEYEYGWRITCAPSDAFMLALLPQYLSSYSVALQSFTFETFAVTR